MGNIVPQIRDVDVGRYYPPTVSPAKEFQAIANAENPELKRIWIEIWKQFMNTFVYDIDEDGASRWESMLRLYPSKSDTLETRRKAILAKINSMLPYTERSLQAMLDSIYGQKNTVININYNKYELWVDIMAVVLFKTLSMRNFLRVIIPANMAINISNTQKLNQSLFTTGYIRTTKHVTIQSNSNFSSANIYGNIYAVGAVRKVSHVIIRS